MAYEEARLLYAIDNRDLNYDKYFKEGDVKRAELRNSTATSISSFTKFTPKFTASITHKQRESELSV